MKRILVFTVTLLLTVLFSACSEQPTQFSVTMGEQYAQHEPITLTVLWHWLHAFMCPSLSWV